MLEAATAKTLDEFVNIINNFFAGRLRSSSNEAFSVAQKYSIENNGYKLKKYMSMLCGPEVVFYV